MGATSFTEGLCAVPIYNSQGKREWGYIDETGEMVIPPQFDQADCFHGGVAPVKKDGKWGVINKNGKLICPYFYDDDGFIPTIHDGIIRKEEYYFVNGKKHLKFSYIDINGNVIIDTSHYYICFEFCNGYANVLNHDDQYALINTKGDVVIPFGKYDSIGEVHCGVALVNKNVGGKPRKGYVNMQGEEIVPVGRYDEFYNDSDMAVVCAVKDGKYGYIDKRTGNELIPCEYTFTNSERAAIHRGTGNDRDILNMFVIHPEDKGPTSAKITYIYNSKTNKLFKTDALDDIASHYSEGLCAVMKNHKIGFIDESFQLVIPYQIDCPSGKSNPCKLLRFKDGMCAISDFIIDRQGNVITRIPEEYRSQYNEILSYISDGVFILHLFNPVVLMNTEGDIIYQGFNMQGQDFPLLVRDQRATRDDYDSAVWYFINNKGERVFPYTVSEYNYFHNGYAVLNNAIYTKPLSHTKISSQSNSGCYIATAVYGSYDCPEVWTLRRYRDNVLDNTWYGRLFIRTYYAISPTLVKWFGSTNWFREMFLKPLNKWVAKLNKSGFDNTPYQDKN